MTLVRPSSESLAQLVAVFQDKVELLQKLVVLNGAVVEESLLDHVESKVRELEHFVVQAKENIAADQNFVEEARETIKLLEAQSYKASLLEQNLPSHLHTKPGSPSLKRSASQLDDVKQKTVIKLTVMCPTPAAFEAVPKYVRGRLSYEKLVDICELVANAVNKKYKLLSTKPSAMSDVNLKKYKVFKEQECLVMDGSKFISTVEFKLLDLVLDASTKLALGVLKHVNSLKADTNLGVTHYKLPS